MKPLYPSLSYIGRIEISMFLAIILAASFIAAPQQSVPPAQDSSTFTVSGTVVNFASGDSVPNARVILNMQVQGVPPQTITADSGGNFAFSGLSAGRYTLSASHRGFSTQSYLQHGQYFSALVVGTDFDTSHIVLKLLPLGAITGHITDQMGDSIRNASVVVFSRDGSNSTAPKNLRRSLPTDDEGHYRVSGLLPGTYFVEVIAQPWYARHPQTIMPAAPPGYTVENGSFFVGDGIRMQSPGGSPDPQLDVAYEVTYSGGATELANAQPIRILGGETQTVAISLTPVPARHIRINVPAAALQNPNFRPQVNLQVDLGPTFGLLQVQQYYVEPGVYELAGVPSGHFTATLRTFDNQGQQQHAQTIELGDDPEVNVGAAPPLVTVGGVLVGEAGFSPTGSHVILNKPGVSQFNAAVAPDGTFEFKEKFPPGVYSLVVNAQGPHFMTNMTATGANVAGRSVEIGSQDVRISVTISGTFADASGFTVRDGKRAPAMLVVILPQGPTRDIVKTPRFDQSNGDGSFNFPQIPPGNYVIFALENAWDLDYEKPDFLAQFASKGQPFVAVVGQKYTFDLTPLDAAAKSPGQ
jgi:hypothetical protein